jgi:hypothetical protein
MRQRDEKQVPDTMSAQRAVALEPMLEESTHRLVFIGERDETVAYVAGRQDAEFVNESAGTPTVVRDGDDSGQRVHVERLTTVGVAGDVLPNASQ